MDPAVAATHAESLTLLCLRLEIVAGVESPAAEQPRRMQLQIERFNKGEVQKDMRLPVVEFAILLKREWCLVGPVEPVIREGLTTRFRTVLDKWLED
jgi:hypothetical protein